MKFRKFLVLMMAATMAVSAGGVVQAARGTGSLDTKTVSDTESASGDTEETTENSKTERGTSDIAVREKDTDWEEAEDSQEETPATIASIDKLDLEEMFSNRDLDAAWEDTAAQIVLSDTSAKAEGSGVQIEGTTVTITEAGTYVLSGTLKDGQIVVDADDSDKVQLVLAGVTITNDNSACLLVKSADKVILTLAEGSENTLSDTGSDYVQTDEGSRVDGVIFSREDLTINGSGTLHVEANYNHGIVSKDDLVITGGTITIQAENKGLVGEDSIRIRDAVLDVNAGDDAVHSSTNDKEGKGYVYVESGSLTLQAGDDGIHAATALIIAGGTIDVTGSYEGLEGATIDILDGDINVTARDDGINAAYSTGDSDWEMDWDNGGREWMQGGFGGPEAFGDWPEDEDFDAWRDEWPDSTNDDFDALYEDWAEEESNADMTYEYEEEELYAALLTEEADDDRNEEDEMPEPPSMPSSRNGGPDMRGGHGRGGRPGGFGGGSFGGPGDAGRQQGNSWGEPGGQQGMREGGFENLDGMQGNRGGFGMMDAQTDAYLRISGGTIFVSASGDGLDANGYLYMDGGTVIIEGPTDSGNGALDTGIESVVTGGTLLATGSAGMAESFGSDSTQNFLYYTFEKGISGDTELTITDEGGNVVYTYTPEKSWQNVVFTSPELKEGVTYTISAGSSSGTADAGTEETGYAGMGGGWRF